MLVVINPVDVLIFIALKRSGWDRSRVIGSGNVIDSARFRHISSNHCGVDVHNVNAYMLGEQEESEFAAWSMTHVAGINIDEYCPTCNKCSDRKEQRTLIKQQVRDSAYHIINYNGSTHYVVSLALFKIAGAILSGQNSVLTVSTLMDGEFGIKDVCLSMPCIVSQKDIIKIIKSQLSLYEVDSLYRSAEIFKNAIDSIKAKT